MQATELMIWAGASVTLLGVVGLVACVAYVLRLRRTPMADTEMRRALQKGVAWNMASLFVSVIGLMMVIVGITLG